MTPPLAQGAVFMCVNSYAPSRFNGVGLMANNPHAERNQWLLATTERTPSVATSVHRESMDIAVRLKGGPLVRGSTSSNLCLQDSYLCCNTTTRDRLASRGLNSFGSDKTSKHCIDS